MAKSQEESSGAIITCSALKEKYRIQLQIGLEKAPTWIFLNGSFETIFARINQRKGHYMPPSLLQSQFDALEIPKKSVEFDIEQSPIKIVSGILEIL